MLKVFKKWWRVACAAVVTVLVAAGTAMATTITPGNPQTGASGVTPETASKFVGFIVSVVQLLGACVGAIAIGTALWKGIQMMSATDSHKHADAMVGLWRWVIGAMVAFGAALLVGLVKGLIPAA